MNTLTPMPDQPGLFRDGDGRIHNIKDYRPFEHTIQFDQSRRVSFVLRAGAVLRLDHWSIVMHPWHEVIPPSLIAKLTVAERVVAELPLFSVAEPLQRSADCELERRLARVEAALKLDSSAPSPSGVIPRGCLMNQLHRLDVEILGPADDFVPLYEMTKHFMLRLRGIHRPPVTR